MRAPQSYLLGAAIFCGCAASVWALRGTNAGDAASSAATESSRRKATKTSRSATGKTGVPVQVTEALAAVRAQHTVEDRLRATIRLAESIPAGDFEKWFKEEWFDGSEDMQSYLFHRIVRARWLAADPEGLMSYCLREKSDHGHEVAAAWAEKDPAAALRFAAELKDPGQRSTFLSNIGHALAKADPQRALDSLSTLAAKLSTDRIHGLSEIVRGLVDSAPELLKAKLDELPEPLRATARNYLARAALKRDFRSAVAELGNSTNGKNQFVQVMRSDSGMIKEMARNLDVLPQGWFAEAASKAGYHLVLDDPKKWLDADLASMDFSPQQAKNLRAYAISALAGKDPGQVIALLAGQELSENERSSAIYGIVSKMGSDKEKTEAWIATLTDGKEIQQAKTAFASRSGNQEKEVTPTALLASLAGDSASVNWSQARVMSQWNDEDRAGLAKEFAALPPEQKQKVAGKFIDNSYQEFPVTMKATALRYLLENSKPAAEPGSRGNQGNSALLVNAAAAIGSAWAEENPNEASRWVDSLPAGPERLWAAKNLAARWSDHEPAEARKWLAGLPSGERSEVQKYLDSGQASH